MTNGLTVNTVKKILNICNLQHIRKHALLRHHVLKSQIHMVDQIVTVFWGMLCRSYQNIPTYFN